MVEINQRKAFSICWRGRRELITDVRKPEIPWFDVIVGRAILRFSDHHHDLSR